MASLRLLARLILREAHDQSWTTRFFILTATAGVLTPLIVYAGIHDLGNRQQQVALLEQQRQADLRAAPVRPPGRQVEPALRALRRPVLTSLLVRGTESRLANSWDFGPDGTHLGAPAESAARTPESGMALDLDFVIRILLGLLALLLATDSLAGERETGTLYALITQPVRRWHVLAAKLGGGVTVLALSLGLVLSSGVLAIGLFGPQLWSRDLAITLASIGGASVLYLICLYALGLCLGSAASSSTAANVWAMSLWILLVLAPVSAFDFVASALSPIPARGAFEAKRQSTYDTRVHDAEVRIGPLLLPELPPGVHMSSVVFSEPMLQELKRSWADAARATRTAMSDIDQQYAGAISRQRALLHRLSPLSPASVFHELASRLAGTGPPTVARWEATVEAYQAFLNRALFDDPARLTARVPADRGRAILQVDLRPLPTVADFATFEPPTFGERLRLADAVGPLLWLLGWTAVFVAGAFVSFGRMTLRG